AWDGRFRLLAAGRPGGSLGALGPEAAARLRPLAPGWPAALLSGVPAIRQHDMLAAVPALGYPDAQSCAAFPLAFAPAGGSVTGGADWRGHAAH
ncbi:hypothetical protein CKO45_22515, partial [Paracraurococcus ruber]|nr:hypothetical protein [Paracraurococcus ruber]